MNISEINSFLDNELLSKINDLETKIQICDENVATCESNLTKEKNFAAFQKQKNQKLKKIIFDTRKNNQILKNQLSQNQCDNSKDIIHQNEIDKLEFSMDILKKENEELKLKVEGLEKERDAETEKSVQCQSENVENLKLILELKTTESKLTSYLEDCKTTDADLVISKQELKECSEELNIEVKKNLLCKSEKKTCQEEVVSNAKRISELQSGSAEHIITQQELHDCEEELEDEIRKNKNLRTTASSNRKRAQECQDKLEDEVEAKEILQEKFESFRPLWGEWSDCSRNCDGIKTRMDQCSFNNKETEPCDDNCSKTGTSVDSGFSDLNFMFSVGYE